MTYDYRPLRKGYTAHIVVLWLFLLSGACFVCSGFVPRFPALLQCLGVFLLLPAIQLIARYLAVSYLYRLTTLEDGTTDLEIFSYRGGDRMQLVCRVGLYEITASAPLSKENRRAPRGLHRYGYSPDLCPPSALVLSVTNADGDCEILLCPDEKMTEILCAAPANAVRPPHLAYPAKEEQEKQGEE